MKKNFITPPEHLQWFGGELDVEYDETRTHFHKWVESEIDAIIDIPKLSQLIEIADKFAKNKEVQKFLDRLLINFLEEKND